MLSPVCLINLLLLVLLPLSPFNQTCCCPLLFFSVNDNLLLSLHVFSDPDKNLSQHSFLSWPITETQPQKCELLRPTQCINSNRHIFLLTLSPLISHCNAHSFFLEYYISHTDICHTQSFVFLMSQSTKQHRHPIRSLSTLFLPAVCHH